MGYEEHGLSEVWVKRVTTVHDFEQFDPSVIEDVLHICRFASVDPIGGMHTSQKPSLEEGFSIYDSSSSSSFIFNLSQQDSTINISIPYVTFYDFAKKRTKARAFKLPQGIKNLPLSARGNE